jgi:hypothetical protein
VYNKFDRFKINANSGFFQINHELFSKKVNPEDLIILEEYNSVGLRIKVNHINNTTSLDFSSKLLGVNYIEKINITNIKEIYKKINEVVTLNFKDFLSFKPYSAEVVSDLHRLNIPEDINAMYSISKYQDQYKSSPKIHKSNKVPTSFYLKKNVITSESLDYISIYNKYNEFVSAYKGENVAFLQKLTIEEQNIIKSFFMDVLRIESKLNQSRIKTYFNDNTFTNIRLYDLLTSKINVNERIINKVFNDSILEESKYKNFNYKQFDKYNTLCLYNNNLEKIYEKHRELGNSIQKSKLLKPYKEVLKIVNQQSNNEKIKIINSIKDQIKW